jgi:hypothetical protein
MGDWADSGPLEEGARQIRSRTFLLPIQIERKELATMPAAAKQNTHRRRPDFARRSSRSSPHIAASPLHWTPRHHLHPRPRPWRRALAPTANIAGQQPKVSFAAPHHPTAQGRPHHHQHPPCSGTTLALAALPSPPLWSLLTLVQRLDPHGSDSFVLGSRAAPSRTEFQLNSGRAYFFGS